MKWLTYRNMAGQWWTGDLNLEFRSVKPDSHVPNFYAAWACQLREI